MGKAKSIQESREALEQELMNYAEKRNAYKRVIVHNPLTNNFRELKQCYFETVDKMKRICDELGYNYYEHEPIKEK